MKLVDSGTVSCPTAPAAAPTPPARIGAFGAEDDWETRALARYRRFTTSGFATRLYDSEPDLLQRRPAIDASAPRKHRRCATLPKSQRQPPARTAAKAPVRKTASQHAPSAGADAKSRPGAHTQSALRTKIMCQAE